MSNKKVSIKEVANLAGVSKTTVSHALSGKRYVSEKTKIKIEKVINKLQYYPNYMAQSLVSKKTSILGMIYPTPLMDSNHRENVEFIFAVAKKTNILGYKFLLLTGNYNDENQQILEIIRGGHVDGVVLMDIRLHDERVDLLKKENFPFVMIGRNNDVTGLNYVDIDATEALYKATNYLVSLGHKDILFLGISPQSFGFTQKSILGYKKACEENNIQFNKNLLAFSQSDENEAFYVMKNFIKNRKFTSVITGGDMIAIGVLKALKSEKIKIPEDVSVITFGNSSVCTMTSPLLTALSMRYKEMSEIAVEMLIKKINNIKLDNNQILLNPDLVIRETSGKISN